MCSCLFRYYRVGQRCAMGRFYYEFGWERKGGKEVCDWGRLEVWTRLFFHLPVTLLQPRITGGVRPAFLLFLILCRSSNYTFLPGTG